MSPSLPGSSRGFTLIEIVVTLFIISVLAALAIFGVNRYLASARASEAKNNVGAISRAAHAAHEREYAASQGLAEGDRSAAAAHRLCGSAILVPGAVPKGSKYQPNTADGNDFVTGDDQHGWLCLKFEISQPIYYQLAYTKDSSPIAPTNPASCNDACYEAAARGDLNGNGLYSAFARTGHLNTATGELKASTQIYVFNEYE